MARHDVAGAVREALRAGTLYAWAAAQPGRDVFLGRGEAFGVVLGPRRAVVRHARRGGWMRLVSTDRFFARRPRFLREMAIASELVAAGILTPAVLAGVCMPAGLAHRADVATERLDGPDLAALLFGDTPPAGAQREAVLTAVARMVRRLHHAGFVHPDLQLRNVLMTGLPDAPVAALLDVDTCRRAAPHDPRGRRANLLRFLRSWEKWNQRCGPRLTERDRASFLAAYDPARRL